MNASADQLLDRINVAARATCPPGAVPTLDPFPTSLVANAAVARSRRNPLPELRTPSKRTAPNLAAMRVAASTPPDQLTLADRRSLAGCRR